MRRILMISPHFPPDTSAGTHRVRLLAPHLMSFGWLPTVVTVRPQDYEGRLDPALEELVPRTVRVVRAPAWNVSRTRLVGVGSLGLRALHGISRTCEELLRTERYDAVFITIHPGYTALLGPRLKRRHGLRFVLDYQDPWVGSWGASVGGGPHGKPDFKSRASRWVALRLEPRVVRAVDAITAVSSGTYEEILARNPGVRGVPTLSLPLGGEATDFEKLRGKPLANTVFDPKDGLFHLCYVGTLLPLGFETLRTVLKAAARLRRARPELYARLRVHFIGTSNQTDPRSVRRVVPVADEIGVGDCVSEIAPRIDYLDALAVLTQANAILLMGSSEHHYTASKLYPALLARRPLLALFHRSSTVVDILQRGTRKPTVRLIAYDDERRAESMENDAFRALRDLLEGPAYNDRDVDMQLLTEYSAETLAGRLASFLDQVVAQ
ncbi:MAG TPA: glycosyltransferase [Thermoanaerobaculaceae bacterium]|nr:glycosyltransferase [Thermoanaerobaculaceae bacterium]